MTDHARIRLADEIAEQIDLYDFTQGGDLHDAIYGNDRLIDMIGTRDAEALKTGLRQLGTVIRLLKKESQLQLQQENYLISRDALLGDIDEWELTHTPIQPSTAALLERAKQFIQSTVESTPEEGQALEADINKVVTAVALSSAPQLEDWDHDAFTRVIEAARRSQQVR